MKNRTKFVGIIALFALVGFFFVACSGDDGSMGPMGPAGDEGLLRTVRLDVRDMPTAPIPVYAQLGSLWNRAEPRPGTDEAFDQGGWTAIPSGAAPATQWNPAVAPVEGVLNFMHPFVIYNPTDVTVNIRIRLSNSHDFALDHVDPRLRRVRAGDDPVAPTYRPYADAWGTWVASPGVNTFWIVAHDGAGDFGRTGWEDEDDYTHFWPSLGVVADWTDVEEDFDLANDDYEDIDWEAATNLRDTRVILDVAHGFGPWVVFENNDARTFEFNLAVDLQFVED